MRQAQKFFQKPLRLSWSKIQEEPKWVMVQLNNGKISQWRCSVIICCLFGRYIYFCNDELTLKVGFFHVLEEKNCFVWSFFDLQKTRKHKFGHWSFWVKWKQEANFCWVTTAIKELKVCHVSVADTQRSRANDWMNKQATNWDQKWSSCFQMSNNENCSSFLFFCHRIKLWLKTSQT